ncbi:MAG TPA: methylated-DNA--[protein]-cysteine S-methyltransferase [Thermoleophilaceae bacterium]
MSELEKALRRDAVVADLDALTHRFAERAAGEGLLDIAYAELDSPLGRLVAASTDRGLVTLSYADSGVDPVLERLAAMISPRVLEAPARLDDVQREVDEYFEGRRHDFDLPIDWALVHGFTARILQATARIPFGEVSSYRGVAREAGNERAVRAAGNALGANPIPIVVPCHRVLRTGGALGGYTGGVERKKHLLALEGVLPR